MKSKKHKKVTPEPKKKAAKIPAAHIRVQVFVSGMAVMAVELAASRLYAPYFGSSVFVWAGLIGALLLFLAAGYHVGGRLSRAGAGPDKFFLLALAASVFAGAAPYIARPVMAVTSDMAGIGGNMLPGVLATSVAALAIPLVLYGSALPLATGVLARVRDDAGSVAGLLYALSTAGSIIGVFLPVLVTLPTVGTRLTFLIFSAAPALVAAAGLGRVKWALLLLIFVPYGVFAGAAPVKPAERGEKQIAERETAYNYARIVEKDGALRMTVDQGWFEYSVMIPGKVRSDTYRDYFPLARLLSGKREFPGSVCILGAAGGTDARVLRHVFPGVRITGVEIDPGLVSLGEKYMGLKSATDRIVVSDGRAFLRKSGERYDLIIVDVYNQAYIPFHMATVEFFRLVRSRLAPGGVVAFNVAWRTGDDMELVRRCADTLRRVFPTVYLKQFEHRTNTLFFAAAAEVPVKKLQRNIARNENSYIRSLVAETPVAMILYTGSGPRYFTDDLAPVEYLTDVTIGRFFSLVREKGYN